MKNENQLTRKEFLSNGAKIVIGTAAGVGIGNAIAGERIHASEIFADWPWAYAALDVETVRKAGHDAYWSGKGCSYGAFHAIITALRTTVGDPYNALPTELMIYGHGGTVGWGTLCGALNGAAGVISLVCTKARSDILVGELLGWYTETLFPTDISNQYAIDEEYGDNRYTETLLQNMSGSPLCHASVTEWCKAASIEVDTVERKDRCARLTGDVSAYAVKILNDEFAGTFVPGYAQPASTTACLSCHSGTAVQKNVAAKMECQQCHGNPHGSSAVELVGGAGTTYRLMQNYPNPFNPSTKIQFVVPVPGSVSLSVYDVHGRLVRALVVDERYQSGTFEADWDGRDADGKHAPSGVYFSKLVSGSYQSTKKMVLVR